MINDNANLFLIFGIFTIILGVCGFYCIMVTKNFIRALIGLEILTKAVTLLIIAAGYVSNRIALAQSMVITLIVVEVVVISVAAGIVFGVFKQIGSLNITKMRNLKG
ncbi:MAG: NADH-quinone oxidoreductase subunit K [Proteobacteria bacterium]|nr:NADH-quinone oxidoreductase subunit K [Pseudomonadota bacterium]